VTSTNPATTVARAFEEALFVSLRGGHARPRLIQCGVNALSAGLGGEAMVGLAGADADLPVPALLELLRAAAAEVGLALPDVSGHALWLARHADAIEPRIPDVTLHRGPSERFDDDLRVVSANLAAARPRDPAMLRFVEHLSQLIDRRIDRYEPWLDALSDGAARLEPASDATDLARHVSSLIHATSYGALEVSDLRAVRDLRERSERL